MAASRARADRGRSASGHCGGKQVHDSSTSVEHACVHAYAYVRLMCVIVFEFVCFSTWGRAIRRLKLEGLYFFLLEQHGRSNFPPQVMLLPQTSSRPIELPLFLVERRWSSQSQLQRLQAFARANNGEGLVGSEFGSDETKLICACARAYIYELAAR